MVLHSTTALRVARATSYISTRRPAPALIPSSSRSLTTISEATRARTPKEEGSIANAFSSLEGQAPIVLPERFSALKKEICKDPLGLVQSWKEVLKELEGVTEEIIARGSNIIPRIPFSDLRNGLSAEQLVDVKKTGALIVTGGVPKEEALQWKQDIRDYAALNVERLKGFPADNIQVYELYNSKSQLLARTHPALIETQRSLLSLWHTSDPSTEISLSTPISYFDRLRIRHPGDAKFALGPHIDGGSLERWEDPGYRSCFRMIFEGGGRWREHDPFDASPKIDAKQDLHHGSNQCSVFRPWQGWTSMSSTGPNEGTLRVYPRVSLSTAYVMLRPFFRRRPGSPPNALDFESWEVDTESTEFPGSVPGKGQELSEKTHPHLRLKRTMVSMPKVEPGDQVYWHCDVIHAVESLHQGLGDSSVLYIPAVPLTLNNAVYLRDQRANFLSGLPAPDFPGGEGESKFTGRATVEDIKSAEGRRMLGLERFIASDSVSSAFIDKANKILFAADHHACIPNGVPTLSQRREDTLH